MAVRINTLINGVLCMGKIDGRIFSYETFFNDEQLNMPVGQIFQIAELSLVRGGEIPEHTQYCDEITYAVNGCAKVYSEGECYELCGGEMHYIKKGASHKIVASDEENFRYICIGFMPNKENKDITPFIEETKNKKNIFIKGDSNTRSLCELLIDETYSNDSHSHTMINLYATQILISVSRIIRGREKRIHSGKTNSGYAIYHTLRYIDREYINIKNVKSVSDALSYSEYYLSHLFKEKLGVSIKEYIIEKKLKNAALLLKTTEMSVGEIAEYLNFATHHTFSQAFKRYYKMSPSEYKRSDSKF